MDNRSIAKHCTTFLGKDFTVTAFRNDDETKRIDIMRCQETERDFTCSTIGLWEVDLGWNTEDDKALRVELLIAGDDREKGKDAFENILATAAFSVMDHPDVCDFGIVIRDVVKDYVHDTELEHVTLLATMVWEKYTPLEEEGSVVTWFQAIPITENERMYLQEHSFEKFEQLLEDHDIDMADLHRPSCI